MRVSLDFAHRKTIEDAVNEYLEAKRLSLSESTLRSYGLCFERAQNFLGKDREMLDITPRDINSFLCTVPGGGKNHLNAYMALSSLWSYCQAEGFTKVHVVRRVDKPKHIIRVIPRFTELDCQRLLSACDYACESHCSNRRAFTTVRPTKARDRAILVTLLDTGVRASELCGMKLQDIENEYLKVLGKGGKEREVPISGRTREVINQYLAIRNFISEFLFVTDEGNQMTRYCLQLIIKRIAKTAGIKNSHAHRFRHTFAINFLRNGGDPYALKAILGHSDLAMIQRYLDMTREDLLFQHQKASPVINWGL